MTSSIITIRIHRAAWAFSDCCPNCFDQQWDEILLGISSALQVAGANIHGREIVKYVPHGATVVFFLAESHAILTTWPEHRFVLFELTSCEATINDAQLANDLCVLLRAKELRRCSDGVSV